MRDSPSTLSDDSSLERSPKKLPAAGQSLHERTGKRENRITEGSVLRRFFSPCTTRRYRNKNWVRAIGERSDGRVVR